MKFQQVGFTTAVDVIMLNPNFTSRKHRLVVIPTERHRITPIKTGGLPTCLWCISIYMAVGKDNRLRDHGGKV